MKVRHKQRGTTYNVLGTATVQNSSGKPILENDIVVVYQSEDGKLYARRQSEFKDGRFETLPEPIKQWPCSQRMEYDQ